MVDFRKPNRAAGIKPETFDFLGFTHYWGKTRKGGLAVKKKTAAKKLKRCISAVDDWCKTNRHMSLREQHEKLCQKIRGHYAYYGVIGNIQRLSEYAQHVQLSWRKWLNRRNSKKAMTWQRFNTLLNGPYRLPPPRIVRKTDNQMQLLL